MIGLEGEQVRIRLKVSTEQQPPSAPPINLQLTYALERSLSFQWEMVECSQRHGHLTNYEYVSTLSFNISLSLSLFLSMSFTLSLYLPFFLSLSLIIFYVTYLYLFQRLFLSLSLALYFLFLSLFLSLSSAFPCPIIEGS